MLHLLVRSRRLSESMSQYLIARIEAHPRIEIHFLTQIVAVTGAAHLESVEWRDDSLGFEGTRPVRHVFVMAGAAPRTERLADSVVLGRKGLCRPGPRLVAYDKLQRQLRPPPP